MKSDDKYIRIETDGDCFISFGNKENPPTTSRDKGIKLMAGSVNYFGLPERGRLVQRLWGRLFPIR